MAKKKTQLSWFRYDSEEWETICDGLDLVEEAALMRAIRKAWQDKVAPATLVDTLAAFERLLGRHIDELEPFLRRYFKPDPAHPGRLSWPWLTAVWQDCRARYERSAQIAQQAGLTAPAEGKKRGRPRKHERPPELPLPPTPPSSPPREKSNAKSPGFSAQPARVEKSQRFADLRRVSPVPNGTRVKTRRVDAPLLAADGRVASPRGSPPDQVAAHRPELVVPRERRRRLDDEPDTLPGELPRDLELPADWRALLEQAGAMPARARAPAAPAAGGDTSTRPEYSAEDLAYFAALDERLREKRAKRASEIATDAA